VYTRDLQIREKYYKKKAQSPDYSKESFLFRKKKQDETAVSDNNLPEPLEHEINGVE